MNLAHHHPQVVPITAQVHLKELALERRPALLPPRLPRADSAGRTGDAPHGAGTVRWLGLVRGLVRWLMLVEVG